MSVTKHALLSIGSKVHLDIIKKVPFDCMKGTQKSLQRPSRKSKGKLIVSIKCTVSTVKQIQQVVRV